MKLLMNTFPYRLELGYELGFGPSVYDTMAEIILAFPSSKEDILFSYTNWDKDLDPHKGNFIEESAQYFHSDMIADPDQAISQKVKEIILHHYAPESDPKTNLVLMDQLMAHFKEVPLDELNEELLLKIGTAVHDMQMIYTLEDRDETTQTFVNSRLVETNSTWLLPSERPVYLKNLLWYRVNSKDDILQSFELTDWWFTCAIVDRHTEIGNYSYFLDFTEEHGDEHDGMVLYITASTKEHFKNTVLPRLQDLLGDKLEIVD